MATTTIAADRHTIVTTGWTNPSNAYSLTGDNVYATAFPAKNSTIDGDFGFPAATAIPSGSTINSAVLTIEWTMSAAVSTCVMGMKGYNNGTADGTAEVTKTTVTEVQSTFTYTTVPSYTDTQTAGRIVARCRATKGNTNTGWTADIDFITLTIDYTAPSGHTVAVGINSETDTSLGAVNRLKTKAVGLLTETDSQFSPSAVRKYALGLLSETDSQFAVAHSKLKAVGIVTETDISLALYRLITRILGLPVETDSAFIMNTGQKGRIIGLLTETDSQFSLSVKKLKSVGLLTETDTALLEVVRKLKALGLISETDYSLALGSPTIIVTLGLCSETDSIPGIVEEWKDSWSRQLFHLRI